MKNQLIFVQIIRHRFLGGFKPTAVKIKKFEIFLSLILNKAKSCDSNEIYEIRRECPKTCLDPFGETDCGELKSIEGCFCMNGYVLDSKGFCVPFDKCGCILPDGSGSISVS